MSILTGDESSPLVKDFRQLPSARFNRGKHATSKCRGGRGARAADPGELEAAVRAAGASSIGAATDEQFMQALNSLFVRSTAGDLCSYVGAAVRARPDLAPRIAVAAISVRGVGRGYSKDLRIIKGKEISCDEVNCIVQAAIAADPSAATEIVDAVTAAAPLLPIVFRPPVDTMPSNSRGSSLRLLHLSRFLPNSLRRQTTTIKAAAGSESFGAARANALRRLLADI